MLDKQSLSVFVVIFQHSSLTYHTPLVKDQGSFYEILSLAIYIDLKAFNQVNPFMKEADIT